ncbi:MAG: glycosyltransferase [Nitrosopumilus sp.]|nr:glycosyltransferase [Nitrosopumilus sp.]MDH3487472.1 glycosyltransferase [Nitrosopumilus sp.]
MKVSIVIPVYNAEKYLRECIESALNQTYKDIEIIAVDDGSHDNSLKILHMFKDKIKIISKKNGGTATALNEGIKKMTGQWFKWLSADDILYLNAVEELMKEVEKIKDEKNTILYTNYDIIDSNSKVIKQFIEPNYNNLSTFDFNVILLDHYIGNGTTSLIHKLALDEYGNFDESVGFAEDYELWLRFCLLHNCRLHLVPKILAKYRAHQTQLSVAKMDKALENANEIRKYVLNKLDKTESIKYIIALKKFRNTKSLTLRVRHSIRNEMFKILPKSISEKIFQEYLKRK